MRAEERKREGEKGSEGGREKERGGREEGREGGKAREETKPQTSRSQREAGCRAVVGDKGALHSSAL